MRFATRDFLQWFFLKFNPAEMAIWKGCFPEVAALSNKYRPAGLIGHIDEFALNPW
jgi:hypothetical protein